MPVLSLRKILFQVDEEYHSQIDQKVKYEVRYHHRRELPVGPVSKHFLLIFELKDFINDCVTEEFEPVHDIAIKCEKLKIV